MLRRDQIFQQNVNKDGFVFLPFQGMKGLEELSSQWATLIDSIPNPRFVHFPEWYKSYLLSLEPDTNQVWFITARRNDVLIGIFPMHFQNRTFKGMPIRVFGTIEHDEMQSSDFIFAPMVDNEKLMIAFIKWLRSQNKIRWDALRMRKIAEDSSISYSLHTRLPKGTVMLQHDNSCYFDTKGTYEQATAAMSGSFRRNMKRLSKRAEQSAPLSYKSYYLPEELPKAFETFLEIEASGWKGDAGTSSAIRCHPPMLAFYRTLMTEFGAINACVINILWHGDQAVAGQFCLKIGDRFNILKIGFRESSSSIGPGNLLLDRVIRRSCEDSEINVLHLVNDPCWAKIFKPLKIGVWSYCSLNWNIQGILVHMALLTKRKWIKYFQDKSIKNEKNEGTELENVSA